MLVHRPTQDEIAQHKAPREIKDEGLSSDYKRPPSGHNCTRTLPLEDPDTYDRILVALRLSLPYWHREVATVYRLLFESEPYRRAAYVRWKIMPRMNVAKKQKVSMTYSLIAAEVAYRGSQKRVPHVKTMNSTQVRRILESCYVNGDAYRQGDLERLYKKSRRLRGRTIDSKGKVVPFGGKTVLRSALWRRMQALRSDKKVGQFLWRIGINAPEHIENVFDRPLEPLRYYWKCDPDFLDYVLGPGILELRSEYGREKGTSLALAVMRRYIGKCRGQGPGRPPKGDPSPLEVVTHLFLNFSLLDEPRLCGDYKQPTMENTLKRFRDRIDSQSPPDVSATLDRLLREYRQAN